MTKKAKKIPCTFRLFQLTKFETDKYGNPKALESGTELRFITSAMTYITPEESDYNGVREYFYDLFLSDHCKEEDKDKDYTFIILSDSFNDIIGLQVKKGKLLLKKEEDEEDNIVEDIKESD